MSRNRVQRDADGLPKWKNSREVGRIVHKGLGLRQVMLSCGKDNCRKCNGKHMVKGGKPLHGPYWYLLVFKGRYAKQWLIGRVLFGIKLQKSPEKEASVIRVLRAKKVEVEERDFYYEPDEWTSKERKAIGGLGPGSPSHNGRRYVFPEGVAGGAL